MARQPVLSKTEFVLLLKRSIQRTIKNDRVLLENRVHERAVAHKFAIYMEYYKNRSLSKIYNFDVDIEYDADIGSHGVSNGKLVIPDIIIHRRGKKMNFAAMEFKWSDARKASIKADREKLRLLKKKKNHGYKHGVMLILRNCPPYIEFDFIS